MQGRPAAGMWAAGGAVNLGPDCRCRPGLWQGRYAGQCTVARGLWAGRPPHYWRLESFSSGN